jgi:hypothetical protein
MTDQTNYRDDEPNDACLGFPEECNDCDELECEYYDPNKDIEGWLIHN